MSRCTVSVPIFESISRGRNGRRVFTGIVEAIGTVIGTSKTAEGRRLQLEVAGWDVLAVGSSIAVNGVCLTALDTTVGVEVDVVPETLNRTNLGLLTPGDSVNVERAMPANGRFDGHVVQGHVDGTGTVESVTREEGGVLLSVATSRHLSRYVVEKGSITVDGVSLTVAGLDESGFDVALIPHTLEVTTLGFRNVGDVVNLEVDILAKYVERLLEVRE